MQTDKIDFFFILENVQTGAVAH